MPSRCIFFFSARRAWSTSLSRTNTCKSVLLPSLANHRHGRSPAAPPHAIPHCAGKGAINLCPGVIFHRGLHRGLIEPRARSGIIRAIAGPIGESLKFF
jgi:hypothetical protein